MEEVDHLIEQVREEDEDEDALQATYDEIFTLQAMYDEILKSTQRTVNIVILISLIAPFLASTRHIILELYMSLLAPELSTAVISSIIFVGLVWWSIFTFIVTWLGDKYGHDKTMMFAFLCNLIGVFLEAIAPNLWIFTIGFFVNRVSIFSITQAYVYYMLPHRHAVQYRARLIAMCGVVYLLGPIFTGLIVDHFSYRLVFWSNAIILAILTVFAIFFVHGSQAKLHATHRSLSRTFVSQQEPDDVFPVCIAENVRNASWKKLFQDLGKNELVVLTISVFQNSICWAIEDITTFYLALYLKNRFRDKDISLLYTAGMIFVSALSFAVTSMSIPKFISRVIPRYVYLVPCACCLYIGLVLVCMFGFHDDRDLILYWILFPLIGAAFGAIEVLTAMCMLEVQPTQHSGKVTAVRSALDLIVGGIAVLIVGVMWSGSAPYYYAAFWIAKIFFALIVLILSFAIIPYAKKL